VNLQQSVFAYLSSHADVTAVVGGRIYPLVLPQKPTYPAITYFKVSEQRIRGLALDEPDQSRARVQFSCWGRTYDEAKAAADAVTAALKDYAGTLGGAGGVEVLDSEIEGDADLYDAEAGVYHVPVDVMILHKGGT
jgi:hypothetical protein